MSGHRLDRFPPRDGPVTDSPIGVCSDADLLVCSVCRLASRWRTKVWLGFLLLAGFEN